MTRILSLLGLVIIALIIALGVWYSYISSGTAVTGAAAGTSTNATSSPDAIAAAAVVTNFGLAEKQVSLLGPDATTTIASAYGSYVDPALLARWQADPQSAPGRVASSPWPDHIVVDDVRKTTDGYEITGTLVMMTSGALSTGGNDGTDPVLIDLAQRGGTWMITNYEDQSGSASSSLPQ